MTILSSFGFDRLLVGRPLACGIWLAVAFFVPPANAIPVTSTSEVIFNFDFSFQTPPPPYNDVFVNVYYTGLDNNESMSILSYGLLSGAGGWLNGVSFLSPSSGIQGINYGSQTELVDGVFSLGFYLNSGIADVSRVTATASYFGGQITIDGVNANVTTVPEPAIAVLLGSGILGAVLSRRRWRFKGNTRLEA